ncbi:MAG: hypothetical protein ACI8XO_001455, partial [Verrucomicrobiales bacterium]
MKYRTKILISFIGMAIAASTLLYLLVSHLAEQSLYNQ